MMTPPENIIELFNILYFMLFTVITFETTNHLYPYPCNEGIVTPAWVEVYEFESDSTYVKNYRKIVKEENWQDKYEIMSKDCSFIEEEL